MKFNGSLFVLMLGISSLLWLGALLSLSVADKTYPFFTKLVVGEYDWTKLSLPELRRKTWLEMYVIQIVGRTYLYVVPTLPLVLVRWTRLRWRILCLIVVLVMVMIPYKMPE
jgi:hypothetical protein